MSEEKEVSLEDIKHMIAYVLDTKNEKIIQDYALALRQMRIDAKDGLKYEYPVVELLDKKYYGYEVEVIDNKIYVDGVNTGQKEIDFDGNLKIGGNTIGGKVDYVRVNGNLTANEDINTYKLVANSIMVNGNINIEGDIHCDDINAGGNVNIKGKVSCDDINSGGDVNVDGKLSADEITAKNFNKK